MQTISPQNYFPLKLGSQPCEGENVVRVPVVFDGSGSTVEIDLSILQNTGHFDAAQTLFLDNQTNSAVVSFQCEVSLQTFQCPIGGFIYMPLLQPNPPKMLVKCTQAITLNFFFINFFLPPVIWGPTLGGSAGGTVAPVTPNNHSGTITAGGTHQIAIPSNVNREGFLIANPDTNTDTLYVQFGSTGGKIPLLPGATYESGVLDWLGDIYVTMATTGDAFTAYEAT